jgi:uncharacterized membrane protein YeaQ/YmgE (transglycosylase-associated protein family)
MSYLFIVVIGAVGGWIAGQFVKSTEHRVEFDALVGAAGSMVAVFLVRMVGPASAGGFLVSAIVAVIGVIVSLYAMRQFMKAPLVPAPRGRRRL